jgi:hypothetical protein
VPGRHSADGGLVPGRRRNPVKAVPLATGVSFSGCTSTDACRSAHLVMLWPYASPGAVLGVAVKRNHDGVWPGVEYIMSRVPVWRAYAWEIEPMRWTYHQVAVREACTLPRIHGSGRPHAGVHLLDCGLRAAKPCWAGAINTVGMPSWYNRTPARGPPR